MRIFLISICCICMMLPTLSRAAPQGGDVVKGQASINQSGKTTTVTQTTQKVAIDWQTFDVSADETVKFIQPSQQAVALNSVVGNGASQILGRIESNGQVFIANTRGIIFGKNSTLNVGGLFATDLSIDHTAFMNTDTLELNLSDALSKGIINQGAIEAAVGGDVTLLGHVHVHNDGRITSNEGNVSLLSGEKAIISFDQDGFFAVEVTQGVNTNDAAHASLIQNTGEIIAAGGNIVLDGHAASDLFTQAVNNDGILEATSIQSIGGEIMLISSDDIYITDSEINAPSMTIEAQDSVKIVRTNVDAVGRDDYAQLDITAKHIAIAESTLTASHIFGGGNINIGNWDKNKSILTSTVYIDANSVIDSSAYNKGGAGHTYILSNDATVVSGALLAKSKGDYKTGFIEVSSKGALGFYGKVDTRNEQGGRGHFLLDPQKIFIVEGDVNGTNNFLQDGEIAPNENGAGVEIFTIGHKNLEDLSATTDITLLAWDTIQFKNDTNAGYTVNFDQTSEINFLVNREEYFDGNDARYFPPTQFLMDKGVKFNITNGATVNIESVAVYNDKSYTIGGSPVHIQSSIQLNDVNIDGGNLNLLVDVKRSGGQAHDVNVLSNIESEIVLDNVTLTSTDVNKGRLSLVYGNTDAKTNLQIYNTLSVAHGDIKIQTPNADGILEAALLNAVIIGADIEAKNGSIDFGENKIFLANKPSSPTEDIVWAADSIIAGDIVQLDKDTYASILNVDLEDASNQESRALFDDLAMFNKNGVGTAQDIIANENTIFTITEDNTSIVLDTDEISRTERFLNDVSTFNQNLELHVTDNVQTKSISLPDKNLTIRQLGNVSGELNALGSINVDTLTIAGNGKSTFNLGDEAQFDTSSIKNLIVNNINEVNLAGDLFVDSSISINAENKISFQQLSSDGDITFVSKLIQSNGAQSKLEANNITLSGDVNVADDLSLDADNIVSVDRITTSGVSNKIAVKAKKFEANSLTRGSYAVETNDMIVNDAFSVDSLTFLNSSNAVLSYHGKEAFNLHRLSLSEQSKLSLISSADVNLFQVDGKDAMLEVDVLDPTMHGLLLGGNVQLAELQSNITKLNVKDATLNIQSLQIGNIETVTFEGENSIISNAFNWSNRDTQWLLNNADVSLLFTLEDEYVLPALVSTGEGVSSFTVEASANDSAIHLADIMGLDTLSVKASDIYIDSDITAEHVVFEGDTHVLTDMFSMHVNTLKADNVEVMGNFDLSFKEKVEINALDVSNGNFTVEQTAEDQGLFHIGELKTRDFSILANQLTVLELERVEANSVQIKNADKVSTNDMQVNGPLSIKSNRFILGDGQGDIVSITAAGSILVDAIVDLQADTTFELKYGGKNDSTIFKQNVEGNGHAFTVLQGDGVVAFDTRQNRVVRVSNVSDLTIKGAVENQFPEFVFLDQVQSNGGITINAAKGVVLNDNIRAETTITLDVDQKVSNPGIYAHINVTVTENEKVTKTKDKLGEWKIFPGSKLCCTADAVEDIDILNIAQLIGQVENEVSAVTKVPQIEDIALKIPDIRLDQIVEQCDDEEDTVCQNRQRFKQFIGSFLLDYAVPADY